MKQRSLFIFCLIFTVAGFAAAQTRSLTNADLEKYRQDRLKAEADYRASYARLGLSSPEELDRRREQSRIDTERLSAKLREERLERERIEARREADERYAADYYRSATVEVVTETNDPGYFWSYGRRVRSPFRRVYTQPGYFAGGQFWPTGPPASSQPMFTQRRP